VLGCLSEDVSVVDDISGLLWDVCKIGVGVHMRGVHRSFIHVERRRISAEVFALIGLADLFLFHLGFRHRFTCPSYTPVT
jgi:hypothetical protein